MAHELDSESFDHETVSAIVDSFAAPQQYFPYAGMPRRRDRFLAAVTYVLWQLNSVADKSERPAQLRRNRVDLVMNRFVRIVFLMLFGSPKGVPGVSLLKCSRAEQT
jgi:hypothetical protein